MKRWDVINLLVKKNNYKTYLEIGHGGGDTYREVNLPNKKSVDIKQGDPNYVHIMSSSDFFLTKVKKGEDFFDLIFIDGSHDSKEVDKDLLSSLEHLSPNGTIVMHDCNPEKEEWQTVPYNGSSPFWTGDVWKSFIKLRNNFDGYNMYVVDTDFGCGIISMDSTKTKLNREIEYTWEFFENNKKELLSLISVDDFRKKMYD